MNFLYPMAISDNLRQHQEILYSMVIIKITKTFLPSLGSGLREEHISMNVLYTRYIYYRRSRSQTRMAGVLFITVITSNHRLNTSNQRKWFGTGSTQEDVTCL